MELSIKALEDVLHDEVINLRSRELLDYYSGSGIKFDTNIGRFSKQGATLKVGDTIRLDDENDGRPWRVVNEVFQRQLQRDEVAVGEEYDILLPREEHIRRFRLAKKTSEYDWYRFEEVNQENVSSAVVLQGSFGHLQVYPAGRGRALPISIVLRCAQPGSVEERTLSFDDVKDKEFLLDVRNSHVLIAAGEVECYSHCSIPSTVPMNRLIDWPIAFSQETGQVG